MKIHTVLAVAAFVAACTGGPESYGGLRSAANDHDQCGAKEQQSLIGQDLDAAFASLSLSDPTVFTGTLAGTDEQFAFAGMPQSLIIVVDTPLVHSLSDMNGRKVVDVYCGAP